MYNVMQQPVGHDKTVQDFILSHCGAQIYLQFKS